VRDGDFPGCDELADCRCHFPAVGLLHTESSRYNEKYRADDRGVGFHLSAACSHGQRTGRSCSTVSSIYSLFAHMGSGLPVCYLLLSLLIQLSRNILNQQTTSMMKSLLGMNTIVPEVPVSLPFPLFCSCVSVEICVKV